MLVLPSLDNDSKGRIAASVGLCLKLCAGVFEYVALGFGPEYRPSILAISLSELHGVRFATLYSEVDERISSHIVGTSRSAGMLVIASPAASSELFEPNGHHPEDAKRISREAMSS